jgi:hypothetical protein
VQNTTVNQWEELCFDVSAPSIEAPFEPATGTYVTVTLSSTSALPVPELM